MIQLNPEKVAKLHSFDDLLDKEYGKTGTLSREEFHDKSLAWYYGEILKERRKELKLTQKQLADKIGKKRSYVTYIEQGKTDMQLSTFFNITSALGLNFNLSVPVSMDEYNSLIETEYIMSSPEMVQRIKKAKQEIKDGKCIAQKEDESISDFLSRVSCTE